MDVKCKAIDLTHLQHQNGRFTLSEVFVVFIVVEKVHDYSCRLPQVTIQYCYSATRILCEYPLFFAFISLCLRCRITNNKKKVHFIVHSACFLPFSLVFVEESHRNVVLCVYYCCCCYVIIVIWVLVFHHSLSLSFTCTASVCIYICIKSRYAHIYYAPEYLTAFDVIETKRTKMRDEVNINFPHCFIQKAFIFIVNIRNVRWNVCREKENSIYSIRLKPTLYYMPIKKAEKPRPYIHNTYGMPCAAYGILYS